MTARQASPRVAILLVILGLSAISVRMNYRHRAPIPRGDSVWQVTYVANFRAEKAGAQVRASFPVDTPHSRIVQHDVSHLGMKSKRLHSSRSGNREIEAVTLHGGEFRLATQFDVQISTRGEWPSREPGGTLTPQARAGYLQSERGIQVDSPVVAETLQQLRTDSMDTAELIERLFEFCQTEIAPGGKDAPRDAAAALSKGTATPLGRARAMVALCRAGKVPARLVTGFEMKNDANVLPHRWVEVRSDGRWESYDPEIGIAREMPRHFVPVRRDGADIVRGKDVTDLHATFSIVRAAAGTATTGGRRLLDIFDLTRLPSETHEPLSLILLIPLGGLLTSVFRTIIGIRTFGTFSPTLIALSFVYNDWQMGLIVFALVMVVGLTSRSLLDRLKLLVVPRLSVMLTLVVLCMVFGISVGDYYGRMPGAQTVLLPMVILTMTVERFFVTTEEDSMYFAGRLLAGTLLVAFCCYLVLCWKTVGHLILVYPEIHLFTVALLIMIGRYSGYRLTELWRFRDFVPPEG